MRKNLVIVMFFILAVFGFAETSKGEVIYLIENDLNKNQEQISIKAKDLKFDEKFFIYNEKKREPVVPFVLNFLLGMGIGSYVEGDVGGGLIGTTGEVVGIIMMLQKETTTERIYDYSTHTYYYYTTGERAGATAGIGSLIFVGTRIFEWIVPWTHANGYNEKLRNSINLYGFDIKLNPDIKVASIDKNGNLNASYGAKLTLDF